MADTTQTPNPGGQEVKKKEKKERLRGLAGLVKGQLEQINNAPKFKERFATTDSKYLLVATDMYPAALVHVEHGMMTFHAVPEEECKKWKKTGAVALLQCTSEQFLQIVMGKLDPAKAWIKRKIKIRGPRQLLVLYSMFRILGRYQKELRQVKEQAKPANPPA